MILPSRALRNFPRRDRSAVFARSNLANWSKTPSISSPSGLSSPRSLRERILVPCSSNSFFSREPAYAYLLKKEFEEHGTKIRSLKDRGDDSPEGELMDGVFDQFAKFERAKTAERSRRGKLRKAREGKIIATSTPDYGFKYTASRDGYKVDKATMPTVRRIFRMVALEGYSLRGIKRRFEAEELLTPAGKKHWSETFIREVIKDDVYRPHSFEEIKALIAPEVAARLDPQSSYGIYWFNRKRHTLKQVAQDTLEGRVYRKKKKKKSVD